MSRGHLSRVRPLVRAAICAGASLAAIGAGGCDSSAPGAGKGRPGRIPVAAAENTWGSIAASLGGNRVQVSSLISGPGIDPHSYEPSAADARTVAGARLAIVNGIGYDRWARRLLDASPSPRRLVLDVGQLSGRRAGENPHQWYSPTIVGRMIAAISAAYERIDPAGVAYYEQRRRRYEAGGLAAYHAQLARVRAANRGAAVGASESIFAPIADATGLHLITPPSFLKAVSEGTEPSAQDKVSVDRQISTRAIAIWVYNSQNSTPDVARLTEAARAQGIPVATITETPSPAGASFEDWQARQLSTLADALARARRR